MKINVSPQSVLHFVLVLIQRRIQKKKLSQIDFLAPMLKNYYLLSLLWHSSNKFKFQNGATNQSCIEVTTFRHPLFCHISSWAAAGCCQLLAEYDETEALAPGSESTKNEDKTREDRKNHWV